METRTCPYDGTEFFPSRNNQVYASPENRIAFNNAKRRRVDSAMIKKNKQLRENYRILTALMQGEFVKAFALDYLDQFGFDVTSITGYEMKLDTPVLLLYDFSLKLINEKIIKVKREHDENQ